MEHLGRFPGEHGNSQGRIINVDEMAPGDWNFDAIIPDGRIRAVLKRRGITRLQPIQEAAIRHGLFFRKSMLVFSPSGSGKTLIGELAAITSVFQRYGKVAYLVPLKALATEKYKQFVKYWSPLGIKVELSIGDYDMPVRDLLNADIIVITYEKMDSMLRSHLDHIQGSFGVMIIDEIHIMGEESRGPRLESLIIRTSRMLGDVQVIGLSATVANPVQLNDWLTELGHDSTLLISTKRPVPLQYTIVKSNKDLVTISTIIKEILQEGGQCLVFTRSRKRAEHLAKQLSRFSSHLSNRVLHNKRVQLAFKIKRNQKLSDLPPLIFRGVAFHHAGLSTGERDVVEYGFRHRIIHAICCTTTLSAGINLPARAVVLQDFKRYTTFVDNVDDESKFHQVIPGSRVYFKPLPRNTFHQIMGRAGRAGHDTMGSCYIIARSSAEEKWIREYYFKDARRFKAKRKDGRCTGKKGDPSTGYSHEEPFVAIMKGETGGCLESKPGEGEQGDASTGIPVATTIGTLTINGENGILDEKGGLTSMMPRYDPMESMLRERDVLMEQLLLSTNEQDGVSKDDINKFFKQTFFNFLLEDKHTPIDALLGIKKVTSRDFIKYVSAGIDAYLARHPSARVEIAKVSTGMISGTIYPLQHTSFDCIISKGSGIQCTCGNHKHVNGLDGTCQHVQLLVKHILDTRPSLEPTLDVLLQASLGQDCYLDYLLARDLVTRKAGGRYTCSKFGRLVTSLYIYPRTAVMIREHLLEVAAGGDKPESEQVLQLLGIIRAIFKDGGRDRDGALFLGAWCWIEEEPMDVVLDPSAAAMTLPAGLDPGKKPLYPGDFANFRKELLRWIHILGRMASFLHVDFLGDACMILETRVKYGIRHDIMPLVLHIKGVGRIRGRMLYRAGYRSVDDVRQANPAVMHERTGIPQQICEQVIAAASHWQQEDAG
ncbi:DEAD/DEAH box helicase [Candidatus Bathyarchaeota archaeon]|nr:DEAD/DEAH box helicase [Candidatus Bathyarchaeota archaeon]